MPNGFILIGSEAEKGRASIMQLRYVTSTFVVGLFCLATMNIGAAPIVTNFPPNNQAGAGYNISDDEYAAVVVTTQGSPLRFDSLEAVFNSFCSPGVDCPYTIQGGIYADGVGGTAPGGLLAAFNDEDLGAVMEQVVTLTTVNPYVLAANTRYWFVLFGAQPGASSMEWIDGGEMYTDSPLAVSDGFATSVNSGGLIWTPVKEFDHTQSDGNPQAQINATAIPEPTTLALFSAAFALAGLRRLTGFRPNGRRQSA